MTHQQLQEQAVRIEGFKEGYTAALAWVASEEQKKLAQEEKPVESTTKG